MIYFSTPASDPGAGEDINIHRGQTPFSTSCLSLRTIPGRIPECIHRETTGARFHRRPSSGPHPTNLTPLCHVVSGPADGETPWLPSHKSEGCGPNLPPICSSWPTQCSCVCLFVLPTFKNQTAHKTLMVHTLPGKYVYSSSGC